MQLLESAITDFSLGMDDSSAATAFPRNAVQALINGRVAPDGTIEVRGGSQKAHASALTDSAAAAAQGFGAYEFRTTAGTVQWVVFIGDKMYYSTDEGATWTSPAGATGLRKDYWSLGTMTKSGTTYLLCANGSNTMYSWDGTTWASVTGPATGMKRIAVFNGRLYATAGSFLYASAIADFTTWTVPNGLLLQIQTNDAEPITGLFQLGPHLLVFKRSSTSLVDGFGNSDIVVSAGATGFSRSVGCIAFRSICAVGDTGVCWLSERGIEYYSPGQGIKLKSERLRGFFSGIAWDTIATAQGVPCAAYVPGTHNYHLALPTTSSTNNRSVVLNLLTGAPAIDSQGDPDGEITLYVDDDGYLAAGTGRYEVRSVGGYLRLVTNADGGEPLTEDANGYLASSSITSYSSCLFIADRGEEAAVLQGVGYDGFVRYREYGTLDNVASDETGGAAIEFVLVTGPMLFKRAARRKTGRIVHVGVIADAVASLRVALRANGRLGTVHTMSIPATAFDQPQRKKVQVAGTGDSLQVELRTNDAVRIALVGVSAEMLWEFG
jgi:hypothetical protein